MGMDSSLESVEINTGPSPNRRPRESIAFNPYCVRLEIVRIAYENTGLTHGRPRGRLQSPHCQSNIGI
jgi:hypothetical protein